ncbi:hypothetical protein ES708_13922 [subsurface metagenome]
MAFMRILSPSSAPPVFLREGSTEIIARVFFGKSLINRLTNSSIRDDFPAPPVPAIPNTGGSLYSDSFEILLIKGLAFVIEFSVIDINRAIERWFLLRISPVLISATFPAGKSAVFNRSFTIPCNPILRPSSGE